MLGTLILFENIDLISFWDLLCENYAVLSDTRPKVTIALLNLVALAVEFEPEAGETGSPYAQRFRKFVNDSLLFIWLGDTERVLFFLQGGGYKPMYWCDYTPM